MIPGLANKQDRLEESDFRFCSSISTSYVCLRLLYDAISSDGWCLVDGQVDLSLE
jgi:hypothetical protein